MNRPSLPVLLLLLIGGTVCQSVAVQAQTGLPETELPETAQNRSEIQVLLQELEDDSFAARQRAMKRIWRSQHLSVAELRRFAESADADAATRIKRIISHIEMGITPETDPEIASLVFAFHSASEDRMFATLYRLRELKQIDLILDLVMSIEDPVLQEYLARNALESGTQLIQLQMPFGFDASVIPKLDQQMDHPFMWKYQIDDCAMYWQLRGQLPTRVKKLRASLHAGMITDDQIKQLVWFHRLNAEPAQALEAATRLSRPQPGMVQRLQLEAGDWTALADSYQGRFEYEKDLLATLSRKAMFHYWSGDAGGFNAVVRRIRSAGKDAADSDLARQNVADRLAVLALSTMNVELLYEQLESMSPGFAFLVLCQLQDYEKAFRLNGAPDSFPEIKVWYARMVQRMQTRIHQYRNQDSSADFILASDLFEFLQHYAWTHASLRDVEQAIQLYELLAEGIRVDSSWFREWNLRLFHQLASLDVRHDAENEIWHFFDLLEIESSSTSALASLFPHSFTESAAWYDILADDIPDAVQRCQTITGFTGGRAARQPRGDVSEWLPAARRFIENQPEYARNNLLFQVGKTLRANGLTERAQDLWLEAGFQGDPAPLEHMGDLALQGGDLERAKHWYGLASRTPAEFLHDTAGFKSAICDLRVGNIESGNRALYELAIRELNSGCLMVVADNLQKLRLEEDARNFARRHLHAQGFAVSDQFYEYSKLGDLSLPIDPLESSEMWQRAIHFDLGYLDRSQTAVNRYHHSGIKQHLATALASLQAGEAANACAMMSRIANLSGVSTPVLQHCVTALDEHGETELANQLFERVSSRYTEVLNLFPDNALRHNNLAWAGIQCRRQPAKSLRHARRAVELAPLNPAYLDTLAEAEYWNGNPQEALRLIDQCIALDPFRDVYRQHKARFEAQVD